ncbi:MAG TPA: dihydrolipoamide acetyltransferase family protein [Gaiellaceae bacterium]|nr:dihydrolipoamide acetyltransferase family protein [Gaiellaceae bacterium]
MATTASIDVVMPQMGVSVSEGTITKWLKQEGEPVAADESLLEISTDKVDTEVPSPGSGVVQQILVQEGETVEVGTKLAVIAPEGAAPAEEAPAAPSEPATPEAAPQPEPEPEAAAPPEPEPQAAAPPPEPEATAPSEPEPGAAQAPAPAPAPAAADGDGAGERTFVSPVVARIASEHGVDVDQVSGTGRGGRVTKKDILAFVESGGAPPEPAPVPPQPEAAAPAAPQAPPEPAPAPPPPAAPEPAPAPPAPAPTATPVQPQPAMTAAQPEPGESFEPVNAMRRGIAEHMRRSLDTSAHVTSAIEVDMSNVVSIRKKLKGEYQASYGVNPTYLAFVARATVDALRDYPWINGELRGDQIVTRNYVNLGFAVELADGKGLIVPVVRNAEGLNLLGMARAIAEIAARARDKKLLPDDVQGGTFTITNPGGYGTFHGTPVISQPQAAILGTYAVVKRPWVIEDDRGEDVIAIRPIMNLTLTYDHRLVDGALAGRFLRDLRERLETWGEDNY